MTIWVIVRAMGLLAGVAAIGACRADPVRADLTAVDAESRIAGIVAAGASDDPSQIEALFEALDDEDPAIRLFAAEALRRRTGQDPGYRAFDPEVDRTAAIVRWQRAVLPSGQAALVETGRQQAGEIGP